MFQNMENTFCENDSGSNDHVVMEKAQILATSNRL